MKTKSIFTAFLFVLFFCPFLNAESLLNKIKALTQQKTKGEITEDEYRKKKLEFMKEQFDRPREERRKRLIEEKEAKRREEIERLKREKKKKEEEERLKKIKKEIEKNPDKAFELPIIKRAEVSVITHLDLQRYPNNKSEVLKELTSTYGDTVFIHYMDGPFDKGLESYGNYFAVTDKKTGKQGWVYSKYLKPLGYRESRRKRFNREVAVDDFVDHMPFTSKEREKAKKALMKGY